MSSYFYNSHLRKLTIAFGTLFDNMYVARYNSDNEVLHHEIVPLAYAKKQPFFAINERNNAQEKDRITGYKPAIKMPRMGFELTTIQYSPERVINQRKKIGDSKNKIFVGTPFDIGFSVYINTKTQTEGLQIVEQILPFFAPAYTVTFKSMSEPKIDFDVPIELTGVQPNIDIEGQLQNSKPSLTWQLDFVAPTYLFGPKQKSKLIRRAEAKMVLENQHYESIIAEPYIENTPLSEIEPESNWISQIDYEYPEQ